MKRTHLLIAAILLFAAGVAGLFFGIQYAGAAETAMARGTTFDLGNFLTKKVASWSVIVLGVMAFLTWLSALVSMLLNRKLSSTDKLVWVVVIVFLNLLGALIYFILIRFYRGSDEKQAAVGKAAVV